MIARSETLSAATTGTDDEQRLIDAARAGDKDAWSKIFTDNYQGLFRYALLRVHEHHPAEELASQVFEEAFRGIKRFRYRGISLRAWLFKIARNLTADYLRERSRTTTTTLADFADHDDALASAGLRTDIARALGQLTEMQQHVIILRFLQDLSIADCAAVIGRSPDSVTALQSRGLLKLRELLDERPDSSSPLHDLERGRGRG